MTTSTRRPSRLSLTISEAELCTWLGEALPGAVLQYHRGFLAIDLVPHSGRMSDQDRAELHRVARRARWAAQKGLGHLVQRRHGADDYEYRLVARRRPNPERVDLAELVEPNPGAAAREVAS